MADVVAWEGVGVGCIVMWSTKLGEGLGRGRVWGWGLREEGRGGEGEVRWSVWLGRYLS